MFGANIITYSKEQGGFVRCMKEAEKFARENNAFLSNQFSNNDNILAHYETTGKEILDKIEKDIGGFVSGIGTGGTLMGIAKRLKEKCSNISITVVEPEKMAILSGKMEETSHLIAGIGDEFIPDIVDRNYIDDIILVNDYDSINMARIIGNKLGLGVGISSGANILGAIQLQEKTDKHVATIFADDNKKYISTLLSKSIDLNPLFLSNNIELVNYEFI